MTTADLRLMDDYLDGTLSDAARSAYETRLAGDLELAKELEFQRILRNVVQARARAKEMFEIFDAEARVDGFYGQFHAPRPPGTDAQGLGEQLGAFAG